MSVHFAFVSGVLHTLHHVGLESVSLLEELVDTLRRGTLAVGQSLQVSRLAAGAGSLALARKGRGIHALALYRCPFLGCARLLPGGCLLAAEFRYCGRPFR